MPIVVDEVVISVDVSNSDNAGGGKSPSGGGSSEGDRQQIVNEAVERVLQILAEREER